MTALLCDCRCQIMLFVMVLNLTFQVLTSYPQTLRTRITPHLTKKRQRLLDAKIRRKWLKANQMDGYGKRKSATRGSKGETNNSAIRGSLPYFYMPDGRIAFLQPDDEIRNESQVGEESKEQSSANFDRYGESQGNVEQTENNKGIQSKEMFANNEGCYSAINSKRPYNESSMPRQYNDHNEACHGGVINDITHMHATYEENMLCHKLKNKETHKQTDRHVHVDSKDVLGHSSLPNQDNCMEIPVDYHPLEHEVPTCPLIGRQEKEFSRDLGPSSVIDQGENGMSRDFHLNAGIGRREDNMSRDIWRPWTPEEDKKSSLGFSPYQEVFMEFILDENSRTNENTRINDNAQTNETTHENTQMRTMESACATDFDKTCTKGARQNSWKESDGQFKKNLDDLIGSFDRELNLSADASLTSANLSNTSMNLYTELGKPLLAKICLRF